MAKKRYSGPPPSIGWWPANIRPKTESIRWWNGEHWSFPAFPHFTASEAAERAAMPSFNSSLIRWGARPKSWPERSKT